MTVAFPTTALEPEAAGPLILAMPRGRILYECGPLLAAAGIRPHPHYADEESRELRFPTDDPMLDIVRVRSFDVATFVALGAAQIGICGADVLMEFDYPEIYAPLDLGIGACRVSVAEPSETAGSDEWPPSTPTSRAAASRHAA
jgi:ATP phosphoribosyltransferase